MKVPGAHIVITGASRGVGASIAREVAARGARVTLVARSAEPLAALAGELGGLAIPVDLADIEQVDGLIARIENEAGPIDALVNNAAVSQTGPFVAQSAASLRLHINANLLSPMELSRQLIPLMLARGHGNVMIISSVAGEIAARHMTAYSTSKAGLNMFAANVQRELRKTPVHLSLMVLGEVQTQMLVEGREDPLVAAIADRVGAMGTLTPERVATAVLDALAADRLTQVIPPAAVPIYWLRQIPSRLMDFALRGIG